MKTFLLTFLITTSISTISIAQEELDLTMVIAEQDDHSLTMDDILVILMSQQQQGLISMNPTEEEIQTVAVLTAQHFQLDPAQCMQEIQVLRTQLNYYGMDESEEVIQGDNLAPATEAPRIPSASNKSSQKEAEIKMENYIKQIYPTADIDFNSPQVSQIKSSVSGALLYNQDSDTYNSGQFGSTTVTSTEMHLCADGTLTEVIVSRMAGGSDLGSFDTGSDNDPLIQKGHWSIGSMNGQLVFLLHMDGVAGGFPIVYEGPSLIMDGKRFQIAQGQANCY